MKLINRERVKDFLLMQISALVISFSNVFSKLAAFEDGITMKFLMFYGLSLFIMMLYAVLWQQILKRVSMTIAYSNRLVSIVWGVVWGCLIFHEKISLFNILGTIIIFIGLYVLIGGEYGEE